MKILAPIFGDPHAVHYYRLFPLRFLHKILPGVQVTIHQDIRWQTVLGQDVLFFARPQSENDLKCIKNCKNMGLKVWVDLDDLLHAVPGYNKSFKFYGKKETQKCIEESIALADVVTASTKVISDFYSQFNKNIFIIPNAFNDYMLKLEKPKTLLKTINWRGSDTHRQDIMSIASQLFDVANSHTDWLVSLIGPDLWYITDGLKNCANIPPADLGIYFDLIKKLRPSIQFCPLVINDFNAAKSNISWIEGVYSGAVCIAPQLPEFEKPGIVNYTQKDGSFAYNLEKLIEDAKYREKNYNESFDYIQENLLLSKVNVMRADILKGLL